MTINPRCLLTIALLFCSTTAHESRALTIDGYLADPDRYERFLNGAVPGIDDGLDLTGTAFYGSGSSSYLLTMISDSHFLAANHIKPTSGSTATFYQTNDKATSPTWTGEVVGGVRIGTSDIWLGEIRNDPTGVNEAPPSWVNRYPIYQPLEKSYWRNHADTETFFFGRSADNATLGTVRGEDMRIGKNRFLRPFSPGEPTSSNFTGYNGFEKAVYYSNTANSGDFGSDETAFQGGDSGGMSLRPHASGGSLFGIHSQIDLINGYSIDASVVDMANQIESALSSRSSGAESMRYATDAPVDIDSNHATGDAELQKLLANWGSSGVGYFGGDYDRSGSVGDGDLTMLLSDWGSKYTAPTDFDNDLDVDADDVITIGNNWLATVTPFTNGDATGDGIVDGADADFTFLTYNYAETFVAPTPITGDFDGDGWVDTDYDYLQTIYNWGTSVTPYADGDATGDGFVDDDDLTFMNLALVSPSSIADLNGDRDVNAEDFGLLMGTWGTSGIGDLNSDGTTDSADVAVFASWNGQGFYGQSFSRTGLTATDPLSVPEPSAWLITLLVLTPASVTFRHC